MARKNTERYVRYYTFGSAAPKLEQQEHRAVLPQGKPEQKRKPISVDPVAFLGCTVAVVLAVLMVVGMAQVISVTAQVKEKQSQVAALEREREMLQERYESGYDLDEVRAAAESMGMIPVEEAVRVQIRVPAEIVEAPQLGWWDSLMLRLRQIFA